MYPVAFAVRETPVKRQGEKFLATYWYYIECNFLSKAHYLTKETDWVVLCSKTTPCRAARRIYIRLEGIVVSGTNRVA